jgi:hypothetical protein
MSPHFKKQNRYTNGFSLMEMLIYISFVTVLTIAVINALIYMSSSYKNVQSARAITASAGTFLNRLSYEVKNANNLSGTFGISTSSLILTKGATTTIITLDTNTHRVSISVNNSLDYLTSADTRVTNLTFNRLQATSTSLGILVQFIITGGNGKYLKSENFQSSVLIRNVI